MIDRLKRAGVELVNGTQRARKTIASIARKSDTISRTAWHLPWPLAPIVRAAVQIVYRGAERLDPTPPGATPASYLADALSSLAAQPRRDALRDVATSYASDLTLALPVGSPLRRRAAALAATLEDWTPGDATPSLHCAAAGLRPGSPGRLAVERAAAESLAKERQEVYWRGSLVAAESVREEIRRESDFWAAYATGGIPH